MRVGTCFPDYISDVNLDVQTGIRKVEGYPYTVLECSAPAQHTFSPLNYPYCFLIERYYPFEIPYNVEEIHIHVVSIYTETAAHCLLISTSYEYINNKFLNSSLELTTIL